MTELEPKPMGFVDRAKSAAGVLLTGKLPNPLAGEPKDKSRAALVKELNDWCLDERAFWKPIFDRIRQEQKFAAGNQWENQKLNTGSKEDYVGDVVQQMVNRKTASLYSKNPTPEAVIRDRLNYQFWDENHQTIANCRALIAQVAPQALAAHSAEQAGQPVPPPPPQMIQDLEQAKQILSDYQRGMAEKARLKKVAATGEKLIKQQWDSQSPDILIMAKQAVTRIITSRVAYIKVLYKRDMENQPTETANRMELDEKLASLTAQLKALEAENLAPDDAKITEIKMLQASITEELQELGEAKELPINEGLVLDWLSATSVIIDRRCTCLKEFIGAHRIAHEMMMTVEEVESIYKISLRDSGAKFYNATGEGWTAGDRPDYHKDESSEGKKRLGKQKVCVWQIQDKDSGMLYTVCDGVKDFLVEPDDNDPSVNRFWSIVPITFNCQEVEINYPEEDCTIYPRSDVRLMMPMQMNINQAGQDKRKHRAANRPAWIGVKSKFASTGGQNDLDKLSKPRNGHDVLMLENLVPGEKISDYLQPLPKQPFDENLYDNGADSQAMMLATGQQPSDMGAQRPDEKATGQNIAAASRAASEQSNIDDLNFAFSALAQMSWEMLVQEMPLATVQKLVGVGATWPEVSQKEIAEAIYFQIEAGSMGRPNQQSEIQKFSVLGPQILQMLQLMGKSPEPLLRLAFKIYDANIDLDALLADATVQAPPAPQGEQQKPPSVSISANLKDLPPEEQDQAIKKFYGLQPAPPESRIINKIGHAKAVDAHTDNANSALPGVKNTPPPPAGVGQPAGQ
jgi:hypothetical protein